MKLDARTKRKLQIFLILKLQELGRAAIWAAVVACIGTWMWAVNNNARWATIVAEIFAALAVLGVVGVLIYIWLSSNWKKAGEQLVCEEVHAKEQVIVRCGCGKVMRQKDYTLHYACCAGGIRQDDVTAAERLQLEAEEQQRKPTVSK